MGNASQPRRLRAIPGAVRRAADSSGALGQPHSRRFCARATPGLFAIRESPRLSRCLKSGPLPRIRDQ